MDASCSARASPPVTGPWSAIGKPRAADPPAASSSARIGPVMVRAPVGLDQYRAPPLNRPLWPDAPARPEAEAVSAVGKPSGPVMPPRDHHAARTSPRTTWTPVPAEE